MARRNGKTAVARRTGWGISPAALLEDLLGRPVKLTMIDGGTVQGFLAGVGIYDVAIQRFDGSSLYVFKHGISMIEGLEEGEDGHGQKGSPLD